LISLIGRTSLHIAADNGELGPIELLIKYGADMESIDHNDIKFISIGHHFTVQHQMVTYI